MKNIGLIFLKNKKGSALVLIALLMPVLLGLCALVIDIGRVALEKQKLQNSIDAACLAGAQDLPNTETAKLTAYSYIRLNGYSDSDINTPTFSNFNYTINIYGSKKVNYTFARVLGFNSINVHPTAAATKERNFPAFDSAIFSGSRDDVLDLSNKIDVVGGSVHSNDSISLPQMYSISMGCEAVNGYDGTAITQTEFIPMPDLSSLITTSQTIEGNWTYDGRSIDGGISVIGDLIIKSGDIQGKGSIIATGTITYNGSGAYANADSAVCLCSLSTEGIILNGSNGDLYGIVYAPNGEITFDGGSTVVNGRLIADTIDLNGAKVSVISNPNDLNSLPKSSVKLTR